MAAPKRLHQIVSYPFLWAKSLMFSFLFFEEYQIDQMQ